MSKELPYFKFEPNQWENGNIQMYPRDVKGLFIDLCSMYWSRLGDLPFKLAVQKLCDGNATALNSLCEENIIVVEDGFIRIDFLEEQLSEFENISVQNSKNALIGWLKRRNIKKMNAVASNPQCESDAIREDKIREDKIKEDINIPFDDFWDLYDKKNDRVKCEAKWKRLSDKEREECIAKTPEYIKATPDKKFRKDPATYLNNKSWQNEIIKPNEINTGNNRRSVKRINDYWNTQGSVPSV